MPPSVLILDLIVIVPPGTQYGIQAHSPVLDAKLHIMHGKQKYDTIPKNTGMVTNVDTKKDSIVQLYCHVLL